MSAVLYTSEDTIRGSIQRIYEERDITIVLDTRAQRAGPINRHGRRHRTFVLGVLNSALMWRQAPSRPFFILAGGIRRGAGV